jgi:rhodanese-related sulfurtransferase
MDQFMQFIINHWLLFVALIAIIGLILFEETKGSARGIVQISPQQATHLINHDNAVVVDVRDASSFQNGHLIDAINITDIANNIKKLTKYKNKPIILICQIGQISSKAGVILKKQGFDKVYFLSGGITAWQKADFPVVKT